MLINFRPELQVPSRRGILILEGILFIPGINKLNAEQHQLLINNFEYKELVKLKAFVEVTDKNIEQPNDLESLSDYEPESAISLIAQISNVATLEKLKEQETRSKRKGVLFAINQRLKTLTEAEIVA